MQRRRVYLGLSAVMGALIVSMVSSAQQRVVRSDLAPDPSLVRYRHSITGPDTSQDLSSMITALEARLKDAPSPFDSADLAELYYRRAQREGDRRDYASSEAMAKRSLELLKKPNTAYLTLAKVANARHEFRRAIDLAREQLTSKQTAGVYLVIATAHLALGEPAAAIEAANNAVRMRSDVSGHLTRALALQAQGRDVEAAFDFARAASLEQPGDREGAARLRALWGRFLLRRGEYAGASMLFDEALRIVPGFALAIAYRGELALRTGNPHDAVKRFEQAFTESRQVRYLIDRARAEEVAGDRAGADVLRAQVETLVRAELEDDGLGHRLDLVEILIDRGRSEQLAEAVAIAREELTRRSSFEVRFQLARALARAGRRDEALIQVEAALALGTKEAQLYELAAQLESRTNPDRSAMFAREAEKLDPAGTGWRTLGNAAP